MQNGQIVTPSLNAPLEGADETRAGERRILHLKGLQGRIMALLVFPLISMVVISALVLIQIYTLSSNLVEALASTVPAVTTSKELQLEVIRLESILSAALAVQKDQGELEGKLADLDMSVDRFSITLERYLSFRMPKKADQLREGVKQTWAEMNLHLKSTQKLFADKKFGEVTTEFEATLKPTLSKLQEGLQNIELNNIDTLEEERNNADSTSKHARLIVICGLISGVIASTAISLAMSTKISKRLSKLASLLGTESLRTTDRAKLLAGSSQNLAQSATQAASAIEETSSAIEEMRAMIERTLESAQKSSLVSKQTMESVAAGEHALQDVKGSFELIRKSKDNMAVTVDRNNSQISSILKVIETIRSKTAVINDIVFQTKLLSFNASVEAARAGEHGKGFAVVAEEIGNLARTSGTAAKEISELLDTSSGQAKSILQVSKEEMDNVAAEIQKRVGASELSLESSLKILLEISSKSSEVDQLLGGITSASREQTQGVSEIANSITQLSDVSSQNMNDGAAIARAAGEILTQSGSVSEAVESLNIVVRGAA